MKKTPYIVFIFCSVVLLAHISFTLVYNFDTSTENTIIKRVVRRYMLPVFCQNNKVFAPDPPLFKQQLLVRYYNVRKGWTGWIDPGKNLLDITYGNRFSIAAEQHKVHDYVLGQVYDTYYSVDTTISDSIKNNYFIHDSRCIMAQHYFSDMAMKENSHPYFHKLQYKICLIYPEKFSNKTAAEIKSTTTELLFPEMNFIPRNVQGY